ncbi:DUF1508 domain-containing protein [Pannus brasiliensis CCIBt3594]|uniref:DUF1508 domain-containing protein n=1 Tax=Pannus brasiliensis CCIBt3594 TaxID=1427578 RepID=A0AAW9QRY0_9CHRO
MIRGNSNKTSLYDEAKASFRSLIQQTGIVFVGFAVILLLTRGAPSGFIITLTVGLGIVFVAWSEQKKFNLTRKVANRTEYVVYRSEYVVYIDTACEYRWKLVASDGKTIAESGESYKNRQDCLYDISLVKGSSNTPIVYNLDAKFMGSNSV